MKISIITLITALTAGSLVAFGPSAESETFQANVVSVSSPKGMATDTVTLRVDRWTQPEEARVLLGVLGAKGPKAFENAMEELDLGRLAATASLGLPIGMATTEETAAGRSIRLILERPLLPRELNKIERSADYRFIVVEFTMDDAGGGKGRIVPAAKLRLGPGGDLEIVSFSEPNEEKIVSVKKIGS